MLPITAIYLAIHRLSVFFQRVEYHILRKRESFLKYFRIKSCVSQYRGILNQMSFERHTKNTVGELSSTAIFRFLRIMCLRYYKCVWIKTFSAMG